MFLNAAANSVRVMLVVPKPSSSLGEPTVFIVRPILEFPRGQGMNISDGQVRGFAIT